MAICRLVESEMIEQYSVIVLRRTLFQRLAHLIW